MPNKKVEITKQQRNEVKRLAGLGQTWKQISAEIGISERTLQRYCTDEFQQGKVKAVSKAASKLWELIESGHPASIMFFLKTQGGWKETSKHEVTGEDGGAIETKTELTTSKIEALNKFFEAEV